MITKNSTHSRWLFILTNEEGLEWKKLKLKNKNTYLYVLVWIAHAVICYTIICVQSLSCARLFVTPWTVSPLGFSAQGIFHARILQWVAIFCSRGSSWHRLNLWFLHWQADSLPLASHVWMWELDHKEGWALKNWCFLICGIGEDSWESLRQQRDQASLS